MDDSETMEFATPGVLWDEQVNFSIPESFTKFGVCGEVQERVEGINGKWGAVQGCGPWLLGRNVSDF
eukprot:scaffold598760_cov130-Attheya_sp.AAC.2